MLRVEVTGDREVSLNIGRLDAKLGIILTGVIARQSKATARIMRSEASSKLKRKTGKFARSVREKPVVLKKTSVTGGAYFGQAYKASVHVGPRGSSRILRPRKSEYLAVPLPTASAGQRKMSPDNFVLRSRAGKLLIVKRQHGGEFLPLFVLKKLVRVPRRIFLDEIVKQMHPKVVKDLEESIDKEIR